MTASHLGGGLRRHHRAIPLLLVALVGAFPRRGWKFVEGLSPRYSSPTVAAVFNWFEELDRLVPPS